MAAGTADELRRAIDLRAEALDEQISDLHGALGTSRRSWQYALELVRFYPHAVRCTIEAEWNWGKLASSRRQVLRPLLLHTNSVSSFTELWLSHGDRVHLSHALEMAIRR